MSTPGDNVVLDLTVFKALASETRINLLKALDERQKTASELGRELALSKAAVHEHLSVLVETGLVARLDDEARKWVYYRLTWKGTGIVNPAKKRVAFFLALSTTFFVGGFVYFLGLLANLADSTRFIREAAPGTVAAQGGEVAVVATFGEMAGAAAVLATAAVALALGWMELRRARKGQTVPAPSRREGSP